MALEDRVRYFYQTLVGIRAIHERQMIHSAISPSTLMLLGVIMPGDLRSSAKPARAGISALRHMSGSPRYNQPSHIGPWVAPEVWLPRAFPLYTIKQADV